MDTLLPRKARTRPLRIAPDCFENCELRDSSRAFSTDTQQASNEFDPPPNSIDRRDDFPAGRRRDPGKASRVAERIADDCSRVAALSSIAELLHRTGDETNAASILSTALAGSADIPEDSARASALAFIALTQAAMGDREATLAAIAEALATVPPTGGGETLIGPAEGSGGSAARSGTAAVLAAFQSVGPAARTAYPALVHPRFP